MNELMTNISTEEAILRAARKVFEEKGFDGARMQEISDRSGINRALLHYYFRSKERMFAKIFDEALDSFMPLLSTWDQDVEESWEWKLRRFVKTFMIFLKENSMLFLLREIIRKPELLEAKTKQYRKGLNKFVTYFERLKEEKLIRSDLDTKYIYIIIHSLCSFPLMNAIVFSYSLRIQPKEYNALMEQYPSVISDLLFQLLRNKENK
jgi:TetR/AcrR family transcriptional regulator